MKIAVLSDIHGNISALKALYPSLLKYDQIFVCGDMVGYYYNPKEVLELLQNLNTRIIKGNHEQMLLDVLDKKITLASVTEKYGNGIRIALEQLTPEQIYFLRSLPESIEFSFKNKNICICHGSPVSLDEYVYPDSSKLHSKIAALESDIFLMGHTHYPMKISINEKLILNPGSVGQPRDRDFRSSWAELDLNELTFTINRSIYDRTDLLKQIEFHDPQMPYLKEVLLR